MFDTETFLLPQFVIHDNSLSPSDALCSTAPSASVCTPNRIKSFSIKKLLVKPQCVPRREHFWASSQN